MLEEDLRLFGNISFYDDNFINDALRYSLAYNSPQSFLHKGLSSLGCFSGVSFRQPDNPRFKYGLNNMFLGALSSAWKIETIVPCTSM